MVDAVSQQVIDLSLGSPVAGVDGAGAALLHRQLDQQKLVVESERKHLDGLRRSLGVLDAELGTNSFSIETIRVYKRELLSLDIQLLNLQSIHDGARTLPFLQMIHALPQAQNDPLLIKLQEELSAVERNLGIHLVFKPDDSLHHEQFDVMRI